MVASKNASKFRKQLIETVKEDAVRYSDRPATQRRILVVNRNYQPITTVSMKKAINKLFNETAIIILPPGITNGGVWQELNWDQWADLIPKENETVLQAAKRAFKIPEIIKVIDFGDLPHRKVKLSRRAIYKRDEYKCQYCGKKAPKQVPMEDLTIDHIFPKSQGGKTSWENIVIACSKCNRRKDNRTPEEAKMPLLSKPSTPDYDILQGRSIRVDSWQHFLGDMYWEVPLKE